MKSPRATSRTGRSPWRSSSSASSMKTPRHASCASVRPASSWNRCCASSRRRGQQPGLGSVCLSVDARGCTWRAADPRRVRRCPAPLADHPPFPGVRSKTSVNKCDFFPFCAHICHTSLRLARPRVPICPPPETRGCLHRLRAREEIRCLSPIEEAKMKDARMSRTSFIPPLLTALIAVSAAAGALAHAPSGAIFTTTFDGSEVDDNIYAAKTDVYLDGGPGPGAPQGAAGLDDGVYVFQVTDPSGKTLLSQDAAKCREFVVAGGIITSVVATGGCPHVTGVDIDHNAITVQLMPYADTPNPGGEYKAWVVREDDFLAGCAALGAANGLDVVDCGKAPGNLHGFIPRHTKTDNFKVGKQTNLEIDARFIDESGQTLRGKSLKWTDTLGGSNIKHSYNNPIWWTPENFAHVEAVEAGTHQITILDQTGCKVRSIQCGADSCGRDINL